MTDPLIVLLYYKPFSSGAATILEHAEAFPEHSRFTISAINTFCGFPRALAGRRVQGVILHYTIFDGALRMGRRFQDWLVEQDGFKTAFFQDEFRFCQQRFRFIDDFSVDCVFTLLSPTEHWVYRDNTRVSRVESTLTGYVSPQLIRAGKARWKPDDERPIDIGYRARRLPDWMGRGAREKHLIAEAIAPYAHQRGVRLDAAVDEGSRLYGDDWWDFLGNCKGVLGVEAGVSTFDLDGTIQPAAEALERERPDLPFEELRRLVLAPSEDRVPYRTVSPRHFEAAAFRCCQILFEGTYNGVLAPDAHYLPLRKDMSNADEILERFQDPAVRESIRNRVFADVIESGKYSYASFLADFDEVLLEAGLVPAPPDAAPELQRALERSVRTRQLIGHARALRYRQFPGRDRLVALAKRRRTAPERL